MSMSATSLQFPTPWNLPHRISVLLVASTSPTASRSITGKKGKTSEDTAKVKKRKRKSRVKQRRELPCHHTAPDRPPPAPPPAPRDFQFRVAESGPIPSILLLPSPRRSSGFAVMGLLVAAEQLLRSGAVDWEQEAYPSYYDFLALPVFVIFFPSVRFFLDCFVFERVARRLIIGKGHHKADNESEETRKKIRKFKESAWKCVYFLSGELLSLSVTYNEPWFTNTKYFWVGPGEQVWPDQKIKLKLKAVYMYAAGFYTYSIFALMFWETRRSDFGVSMSHHVATVVLIILSYVFRFARVGSVVLAIHDASDVFLEVGKMSKYSHCDWLANIAFLLFVLSWVVLRLTYFPFWILRSTSYEVLLTLDKKKHNFDGPIYYYVFNSLLFSLLVLHIYWWVLIYRMLVRQIKTRNVGDDVRSDSEGEDDHED